MHTYKVFLKVEIELYCFVFNITSEKSKKLIYLIIFVEKLLGVRLYKTP